MSSRKKKKRKAKIDYVEVDLNLMPFIDTFSILVTFLLMTAVFVSIGIHEVQVPFLMPQDPNPPEPTRDLEVKADMERGKVKIITSWTQPPEDLREEEFDVNKQGLSAMHKYLVTVRRENPKYDKLQFFIEEDVKWENVAKVLDHIKLRNPDDPPIPTAELTPEQAATVERFLYPKVVMASVIL